MDEEVADDCRSGAPTAMPERPWLLGITLVAALFAGFQGDRVVHDGHAGDRVPTYSDVRLGALIADGLCSDTTRAGACAVMDGPPYTTVLDELELPPLEPESSPDLLFGLPRTRLLVTAVGALVALGWSRHRRRARGRSDVATD